MNVNVLKSTFIRFDNFSTVELHGDEITVFRLTN